MKRRKFLKNSSFAALGSTCISNTLLNLKLLSNGYAATPNGDDYKALVCVFLYGGNDSYNMLVPTESSEYSNYSNIRTNLALPLPGTGGTDALLPLTLSGQAGRTFGLHGAMPKLQALTNNGNATFVANLGSLVERVTAEQVITKTASLPKSLFSHNNQQTIWQTSLANSSSNTGWGGRLADRLLTQNTSNDVSMNISLGGNTQFLVGNNVTSYAIGQDGAEILTNDGASDNLNQIRLNSTRDIVQAPNQHLLMKAFGQQKSLAIEQSQLLKDAFNNADVNTSFGPTGLDKNFNAIAKTIASAGDLGLKRQIFFVGLGSFDQHASLLNNHRDRLKDLDNALNSFWDAINDLELQDQVTTFTCSDFGRTLGSNGGGTDHAWAGHSVVMGGAIKQRLLADGVTEGSKIYGDYPTASELQLGAGLDVSQTGRILPTTSIDEYFAELALWFGLNPSELTDVLPNIENFYTYSPGQGPLGFLNI